MARVCRRCEDAGTSIWNDMKKRSTSKDDQGIPEYKREQLGVGVRGKHYKQFMQGSTVVVLQPALQKAFPTSEVVNKA